MNSDFPEFDKAYDEILLPDNPTRCHRIAAETRFNIYNSPIWSGTGKIFTDAIINECCKMITDDLTVKEIKKHFNIIEDD